MNRVFIIRVMLLSEDEHGPTIWRLYETVDDSVASARGNANSEAWNRTTKYVWMPKLTAVTVQP